MRSLITRALTIASIAFTPWLVSSAALAQAGREGPDQPRTPALAGFQVFLLLGLEKESAAGSLPSGESLTPAIVKALQDVHDLLPFKSFRRWDSAFIRGDAGSTTLKGPSGRIYVTNVNSSRAPSGGTYSVRLSLMPVDRMKGTKDASGSPTGLDASVQMTVGETIVAGTSRQTPGTGSGLVMVVTALPASAFRQ